MCHFARVCSCLFVLAFGSALLTACGRSGSSSMAAQPASPQAPQRGELTGPATKLASYDPSALLELLAGNNLGMELLQLAYTPTCGVSVYHLQYGTVGGRNEPTTASGALMVPNGTDAACAGPRPIVVYAHGTSPDRNFNIADISSSEDSEGLILAAVFAAAGYIVVAPNYAGYDTSTLPYHPYLNADQQSKDMIDALAAARSSLPVSAAPSVTDNHRLFITGYSQGGFVAMATHRAMQAAGMTVTASGPMSGPYALAAFADAVFMGQVNGGAVVNFTLLASSYQHAYQNLYSTAADLFAAQYAPNIESLLPSTTPLSTLYAEGKLPQNALFSSTAPAPQYDSITPATTPTNLAPAFALGFGSNYLVINSYRLAYLKDAQAHPDGGFPTRTTGVPAASPANALRQALKTNDLRDWSPTAPVLLCGGSSDPTVFFFNTQLMQGYWAAHPPPAAVTILDVDSAVGANDPYAALKQGFAAAKAAVAASSGTAGVLEDYHATLVPPFCLVAVKSLFDSV